ncbi:unnamed protein product, partial [Rotaria socialis]
SYLVGVAAKWFRFNKMNIPDWSSFKIAIAQAYQPSFNRTLSVIEQRPITVQHVNSSSVSPKTAQIRPLYLKIIFQHLLI